MTTNNPLDPTAHRYGWMNRGSEVSGRKARLLALLSVALTCHRVVASSLPPGFTEIDVVTNLANATAMEFAPDGRLFVCEQDGALRIIRDGRLLATPFLQVQVDSTGERGLLGVALDPVYASNQYVYVYYTAVSPNVHNRISRFTAAGDVAAAGSELVLLELEPLTSTSHNGGAIHFGPDGALYVAVGDNAVAANSQSLENRLGKILRIQSDGAIPADNPYYVQATGANRAIWAIGLRNPFTFAFDRVTGRMLINDVGEDSVEEINEGVAGGNYGWPVCEGTCLAPEGEFLNPIFQYNHATGAAITGGAFYRPAVRQFPAVYQGQYFFADVTGGWIRNLDFTTGQVTVFGTDLPSPVDLKVSPDGMLYYLSRGDGSSVRRIFYLGAEPQLEASLSGNTFSLSWPSSFTGYRLESALVLSGSGAVWAAVPETIDEVGGRYQVRIPFDGSSRFFRLVKP